MANIEDINIRLNADNRNVVMALTQVQQHIRLTQQVVNVFHQHINQTFKQMDQIKPPSFFSAVMDLGKGLEKLNAPGMAFEEALADISASTGITGKALETLGEEAMKMGRKTGLGALQGLDAYKALTSQAGWAKEGIEGLNQVQGKAMTLAQASGLSAEQAALALGGTLQQFRLEASQAGRVMNVLSAGARLGATGVPELSEALGIAGETAAEAGVSIEAAAGALGVLGTGNLKGAAAGKMLSHVMQQMQSALGSDFNSSSLPDVLESLKPQAENMAYLSEVFGESGAESARYLITHTDAVRELTEQLNHQNVAEEQAAVKSSTLAGKMSAISRMVENVKIRFFNLTAGVTGWISAAGELTGSVMQAIELFNQFKNVVMMLTNAQRLQAMWTGIVKAGTVIWTGVQWVLNAALWACPLTWIIAAIVALVAAIAWVCTQTTGWGSVWKGIVGYMKFSFLAFVEEIRLIWTVWSGVFMMGINAMIKKWYQFKKLVGLGNKKENEAAITELDADTEARKKAIADGAQKVLENGRKARESLAGIQLSWKQGGKEAGENKDGMPVNPLNAVLSTNQTHLPAGVEQSSQVAVTGGSKNTHVVINLGKLMDQVNIYAQEFREGLDDLDSKVLDSLTRVLTIAQSM